MKKLLNLVIFFFSVVNLYSQTSKKSIVDLDFSHLSKRETSFDFKSEITTTTRPKLEIQRIDESSTWRNEVTTYDGNDKMRRYLNGGETITLKVKVKNVNNALATNVSLKANYESFFNNEIIPNRFEIEYPKSIGNLDFNEEKEIEIKVTADVSVQPSNTVIRLRADDEKKQGATSSNIASFKTDHIRYGKIEYNIIVDETSENKDFSGNTDKIIKPEEYVRLKVIVENVGEGPIYDFKLRFGNNHLLFDRENLKGVHLSSVWEQDVLLPSRNGDERKEFYVGYYFKNTEEFETYAKTTGELPFRFGMEDRVTKLSEEEYALKVSLQDNRPIDRADKGIIEGVAIVKMDETNIEGAYNDDRIFKSLPDTKKFALIIGNSNYKNESEVLDIANEDRKLIRDFFVSGFGIPEKNIIDKRDLSYLDLKNVINRDVKNKISGVDDVKLYVYYSGHGLGIKKSGGGNEGLLMPIDADFDYKPEEGSIKQSKLYADIYNLKNLDHAYLFIDACFSGENKDGVAITKKISMEIKDAKSGRRESETILPPAFTDKITLFSSSSGSKRSWSYRKFAKEEGVISNNYSLFTTYLAAAFIKNEKGNMLADKNGNEELTVEELQEYLKGKVSAFSKNEQIPTQSPPKNINKILNN